MYCLHFTDPRDIFSVAVVSKGSLPELKMESPWPIRSPGYIGFVAVQLPLSVSLIRSADVGLFRKDLFATSTSRLQIIENHLGVHESWCLYGLLLLR